MQYSLAKFSDYFSSILTCVKEEKNTAHQEVLSNILIAIVSRQNTEGTGRITNNDLKTMPIWQQLLQLRNTKNSPFQLAEK